MNVLKTEIEKELRNLDTEIEVYATKFGMNKKELLNSLHLMESEVALNVKPLLEKRIFVLKQLWKSQNTDNNLILFSRIKTQRKDDL